MQLYNGGTETSRMSSIQCGSSMLHSYLNNFNTSLYLNAACHDHNKCTHIYIYIGTCLHALMPTYNSNYNITFHFACR